MNKAIRYGKAGGFAVIALTLGCAASVSGCSRTDDGSILVQRPTMSLGFGNMSERFANRIGWRRQQPVETTSFPAPPRAAEPAPSVRVAQSRPASSSDRMIKVVPPRVAPMRVGVKAPFEASGANAKPLTCSNVTQPGGRVKVNCQ
jgi:hypothetical protein